MHLSAPSTFLAAQQGRPSLLSKLWYLKAKIQVVQVSSMFEKVQLPGETVYGQWPAGGCN